MVDLNEAGLSAAEAVLINQIGSLPPGTTREDTPRIARETIESYFEHAEIGTKRRLHPTDRSKYLSGHTVKFVVGGVEGYITMNDFHDGRPGEIFLHGIGKAGSTVTGLMDLVAILISVALQYGVPLPQLTKFMVGMDFEPRDEEYSSIPDFIGRYLEERYGQGQSS